MGLDYYKILGLPRNANDEEIKKAYRKLSVVYHPNKISPNDKQERDNFNQVSKAYEVLTTPNKRKVYDLYGEEGLKNQFTEDSNPLEIFEQFFGTSNPLAANGGDNSFDMNGIFGGKPSGPRKAAPVERTIHVSLEDLYTGVTKKVKITKQVLTGDGKTTKPETKIIVIQVKPGWKQGTKVTYANEGDEGPGVAPGDVIFVVSEKEHAQYTRSADDLFYTAQLSLEKALIGSQLNIETLDGRTLPIPINDVVTPQYVKTIPGEGMPNSKTGKKGDLHIKFNILFPSSFNSSQKQLLKQVFSSSSSPSSSPSVSSPSLSSSK